MNINMITLGKLKEDYFKKASAEYEKRLSAFCKLTVTELTPVKVSKNPSQAEITACLAKEAELIDSKSPPYGKSFRIILCAEGEKLSSEEFAKTLEKIANEKSEICFIIGGSEGLSAGIKKHADLRLSLSDMTFPHRLARIMLLEQLYRAFSIQNNQKYHK
ncbi:MAG: 23S rRNA (pseudouridine(1915)-N(3))-methyltransferase RlmH [Oscillospiraceae bacterium]|nr:23S rRNA (pseudouridine(1915)-N(3))-methyltransferase RlmH [Oscillospiraceae bacterium]